MQVLKDINMKTLDTIKNFIKKPIVKYGFLGLMTLGINGNSFGQEKDSIKLIYSKTSDIELIKSNLELKKYNLENKQVFEDYIKLIKEKDNEIGQDGIFCSYTTPYSREVVTFPTKDIHLNLKESSDSLKTYINFIDYNGDGLDVNSGDKFFLNRDGLFSPLEKATIYVNTLKYRLHEEGVEGY